MAKHPPAASAVQDLLDSLAIDFGENGYGIGNELVGTADAHRCLAKSDMGCCAWLIAGLTPLKVLKLGKLVDKLTDSAKAFCSFTPNTRVLMADGTTNPISEIDIGDQVLATNPKTGQEDPHTVTTLWIHQDTVVDLKLNNDATITTTTTDHPFWNHTHQQWQPAKALNPGDQLLTPHRRAPAR